MFSAVTLEVSLKPFKKTDASFIREVCQQILTQWRPLLKGREELSLMLWAGDGSEILDYDGNLDTAFEWAYFQGNANLPLWTEKDNPHTSLHSRKRLYMENPPKMTYRILRDIISTFKREAAALYPAARITVGATFDIGPEFAVSDFKYKRHNEICLGTKFSDFRFMDSTAHLHADTRRYAAYPDGIPEDTPFATFLGRQTACLARDMGYDYLWLSNGLGFSANPWDMTGKIYDGKEFYPDKIGDTAKRVFDFWRLFREACPDVPLHTRGTNNSAGIDYATDGVPLHDIYSADFNILPPPNSPWAALNGNYGLEIMGHMTRICELPGDEFLFRYYIHDPWWNNSPWYDRYDSSAGDIYLPMAVSRINERGEVESATRFNILSIDNAHGGMPDACVNEPLPHILKAEKNAPTEIPPLVWLYPLKEYTTAKDASVLEEMLTGDRFMADAINNGFPLTCVVSTEVFKTTELSLYEGRVLVCPVIAEPAIQALLQRFVDGGGKVLYYGLPERMEAYAPKGENVRCVSSKGSGSALTEALAEFGYGIRFDKRQTPTKPPVIGVSRSDGATFFSVHTPDTTVDTLLKFPLGAPILSGGEVEIEDGWARYRFSRCEHRECRIFVRQQSGVISLHEAPPVSGMYRRRLRLSGLDDATVYYFPETYCATQSPVDKTDNPDGNPVYDEGWEPYTDPVFGQGYRAEHKSGTLCPLMPFPRFLK